MTDTDAMHGGLLSALTAAFAEIKALKADNAQLTEALYAAYYRNKTLSDRIAELEPPKRCTCNLTTYEVGSGGPIGEYGCSLHEKRNRG